MPQPASVMESVLYSKIFRSSFLTALAVAYTTYWPTLVGTALGSRLLDTNWSEDQVKFDMRISALTTLTIGCVSYPFHDERALKVLENLVMNYPSQTGIGFATFPVFIPIMINALSREDPFSEFGAMILGGILAQLIVLFLFIGILEFLMANENFQRSIENFAFYLSPLLRFLLNDPALNDFYHLQQHHPELAFRNRPNPFSFYNTAKKIKFACIESVPNVMRKCKLAIIKFMLKHLLTIWHNAQNDPYQYYQSRSLASLYHVDSGEIDLDIENMQQILNATKTIKAGFDWHKNLLDDVDNENNDVWSLYNAERDFVMRENIHFLNFRAMYQQNSVSVLAIKNICNFLIKLPIIKEVRSAAEINAYVRAIEAMKQSDEKDDNQELANNAERKRLLRNRKKSLQKKRKQLSFFKPLAITSTTEDYTSTSDLTEVTTPASVKAEIASAPPSPALRPVTAVIKPKLNTTEQKGFDLLESLVETVDHNYTSYIAGGWAYDKVRQEMLGIPPCPFNDIDFVTEIPPEFLEKGFRKVPEVRGLFCKKLDNGKMMDVVYVPDLSNLLIDLESRDFSTFYITKNGECVKPDETEPELAALFQRALNDLLIGRLSPLKAPAILFETDPLEILRTIYLGTKRNLDYADLKPEIENYKHLLEPRQFNAAMEVEKVLNPHRMNLRILKLFTQYHASQNLILLKELNLLEVLFPTIHHSMNQCFDFLKEQIAITNSYHRPTLAIIYATFIACEIALHTPPDILQNVTDPNVLDLTFIQVVRTMLEKSLLFLDVYKNPMDLYDNLRPALTAWNDFYKKKFARASENKPPEPVVVLSSPGCGMRF